LFFFHHLAGFRLSAETLLVAGGQIFFEYLHLRAGGRRCSLAGFRQSFTSMFSLLGLVAGGVRSPAAASLLLQKFAFFCSFPGLRLISAAGTCRLLSAGFTVF
jgi:hypothetical protein